MKTLTLNPTMTVLYAGGLFANVGTFAQHGLVKVDPANGAVDTSFRPVFRPNSGVGDHGGYDGENPMSMDWDLRTTPARLVVGSGGIYNSLRWMDPTTGEAATGGPWGGNSLREHEGDVQATAVVGDQYLSGFHRNLGNSWPYPIDRFHGMWSAFDGRLQPWDPGLWGNQGNQDGGNNGVQAMSYDPTTRKLFVGGAFLGYGDTSADTVGHAGIRRQSLAVFAVQ